MFKKIVLVVSVIAAAYAAYTVYEWRDDTPAARQTKRTAPPPMKSLLVTSQPASTQAAAFEYRGAEIQPGDAPIIRVFNPDGSARIVFQATKWKPLSDTEFNVTQPTARVLLPGGQLAYVRADDGHIVVQRGDKNNYNPKRGRLTGHVQLFIDRTSPDERRENAELADPENRPEAVVKVWMDDVSFDLDLARLETTGPVKVQSVDATVEGRGLTLIWNELNRRIKLLKINQGQRAVVHMNSLVQLGVARPEPGSTETLPSEEPAPPGPSGPQEQPEPEPSVQDASQAESAKVPTIRLSDLEEADEGPKADRIDTYHIVFKDGIIAEQRQGIRVVGRLEAEVLELLRDFGLQERSAVEHAPTSRPADATAAKAARDKKKPQKAQSDAADDGVVKQDSTLELRWSGELVVTPASETTTQPARSNRFHVTAEGNPVRLHDRDTGDATCRRLEYRDETQEVWLLGDPENLVTLQADAHRTLAGERIFLDRKNGIARVEGPGRMTDINANDNKNAWPECIRTELARHARTRPAGKEKARDKDDDRILVTWNGGVDVRFAVPAGKPVKTAPASTGSGGFGAGKEYLQSARFRGGVAFDQPGQSMSAEQIDIIFAEPKAAPVQGERAVAAQTVLAQGSVRMANDESVIHCDRLEVDMTTDDVGRNVPQVGRAFGNVVARQRKQEIRAADQMLVSLESIPRKVDPIERERYEAAAKACGYTTESAEWKAVEEKLASRREMLVRTLTAHGDITVRDPENGVDVGADTLECAFDDSQQITQAYVIGAKENPAHVGMSDFYIRGPRINFRISDQTADVPGEGILRFFTKQDISGRRVDSAVPVVVTWKDRMSFRGNSNTGLFTGQVRAVSEGTILDCRELSLRFENVPEEKFEGPQTRPGQDPRWIAGKVIDLLADRDEGKSQTSAAGISRGFRKRLAYIHAIGDAVIASSEYERPKPQYGPFTAMMTSIMPDVVQQSQPSPEDQRILSFVRISGPRITIDLNNEHLAVEGAGNLLVLDYRPPSARATAQPEPAGLGSSMMGSLQGGGPSQTVFTWQNAMTYINRRNVAVLDSRVTMTHVSGTEMVMPEQVASAMKVDIRSLSGVKSRRAELTCESLAVTFKRSRAAAGQNQSALSSATELSRLQASQRVRMQENNRSVEGESVAYESDTGLVRIQGSPLLPARIAEIDEKTGNVPMSWRGQELEWNLKTGVVTVQGASITAPGR